MVRRLAGLQTCLALVLAFAMGPFQHVHVPGHHHSGGDQDELSAIIHSHLYDISVADGAETGCRVKDSDGSHTAWTLDTFTILLHILQDLFLQPESKVLPFVPAESLFTVEVAEIRGHDPPPLEHLSPRAPPV